MLNPMSISFMILAVVAALGSLQKVEAGSHVVGGEMGWSIPYAFDSHACWAASQNFVVVFKYVTGKHEVARVTKEAYDACDYTCPLSIGSITPYVYNITDANDLYFICSFHCGFGQKLTVNVHASSPSFNAPAPSPRHMPTFKHNHRAPTPACNEYRPASTPTPAPSNTPTYDSPNHNGPTFAPNNRPAITPTSTDSPSSSTLSSPTPTPALFLTPTYDSPRHYGPTLSPISANPPPFQSPYSSFLPPSPTPAPSATPAHAPG